MKISYLLLPGLCCLCGLTTGCQSPGGGPAFSSAKAPTELTVRGQGGGFDDEDGDGWLQRHLTGRVNEALGRRTGIPQSKSQAKTLYAEAEALYKQAAAARGRTRARTFLAAAEKYDLAGRRWLDSTLEEDALLREAECHFFADHYHDAVETFALLTKQYPRSRHLDRISTLRFEIARYWLKLYDENPRYPFMPNFTDERYPRFDLHGHAVRLLNALRLDDPTSKLADDAAMAAGTTYFKYEDYSRAGRFLNELIEQYPSSPHVMKAHLMLIHCKVQTYVGPQYDGIFLAEAEELIKKTRTRFASKLKEADLKYLNETYKHVRLEQAKRDWAFAQYFERNRQYGGAKFYYNLVQKEYGDTSLAIEARKRLARLQGEPDSPPARFAWLTNVFESPDERPSLIVDGEAPGDTTLR